MLAQKFYSRYRKGVAFLLALIFVALFATFAVSLASMSGTNVQLADNQSNLNSAMSAALSGLDCAKYLAKTIPADPSLKTSQDTVTVAQANLMWSDLSANIDTKRIANKVPATSRLASGNGDQIVIPSISYGTSGASFAVRFYRYDSNALNIFMESSGVDSGITKKLSAKLSISKENKVLKYAIAGKGRMWITGNSTIHGSIFSSWKYQNLSPFNMTSDSTVEGTINTILTKGTTAGHHDDLYAGSTMMPYHLETLGEDGKPVYDSQGNKVINSSDEIQGACQGINYGTDEYDNPLPDPSTMPGMKVTDYDTTAYYNATRTANGGGGDIPYSASATQYTGSLSSLGATNGTKYRNERFPHDAGNYTTGSGLQVKRYIYKNQTFTNTTLPKNKNALFLNCTFNGILYVDSGTTGTGNYNNVRFEDCAFNGPIVTAVPSHDSAGRYPSADSTTWWEKNCLYFTGTETFQNNTNIPATILAPNFNVNLGNTNPVRGEDNVLTGAIVGGIVDVRGNAQIYGTIVSMYDTSSYSSGYVTNIGATANDGGTETTEPGDIGTIEITPAADKMLPSGITTPIVLDYKSDSYSENTCN